MMMSADVSTEHSIPSVVDFNRPRPRALAHSTQALLRNPGATIAALILLAFVALALLAPLLAPHDPLKQNLGAILRPPSTEAVLDFRGNASPPHYLGTDKIGRDLLSRVIYGARVSLLVSLAAVAISATIGTLLGVVSGYFRGRIDSLVMILADIQLSFPAILLAISVVAGLGPGLVNTIIVLVITHWVAYARVIRAEALVMREREFVLAARAIGCSERRILFQHILPQVVPPLLVLSTLEVGSMIILEASLSFLGLGIQPPQASWGNLLADGRELLWTAWWMAFFPGLALSLVIWSSNIFGDWLRDYLDPRLRR